MRNRSPSNPAPRAAIVLLLLLIAAAGLLYFLSASVEEAPLTVIEENVTGNAAR